MIAPTLLPLLQTQPVLPVITLERLKDAVPLARALANGGLPIMEITLRSDVALDAIRLIAEDVPDAIAGAGTIRNAAQFEQAESAGARFIVSPGTTQELLDIARDSRTPFLPGAMTPSEIMALQEEGYAFMKFFPAEAAGGAQYLSSLARPLPECRFCPTGGISAANAKEYLKLQNVICVGGSWVCPRERIVEEDWDGVRELARAAARIR